MITVQVYAILSLRASYFVQKITDYRKYMNKVMYPLPSFPNSHKDVYTPPNSRHHTYISPNPLSLCVEIQRRKRIASMSSLYTQTLGT